MDTNDMNRNDVDPTNDPNGRGRENFGCDAFSEELSLLVFGEAAELSDERRAALESHLAACAACRSERDALQRSLELLKSESARESAPQLSAPRQAQLMAAAREQAQTSATIGAAATTSAPARVLHLGRWAIAAGVLATAGAAAWFSWQKPCYDHGRAEDVGSSAAAPALGLRAPAAAKNPAQDSSGKPVDFYAGPDEMPPAAASADVAGGGYSTNDSDADSLASLPAASTGGRSLSGDSERERVVGESRSLTNQKTDEESKVAAKDAKKQAGGEAAGPNRGPVGPKSQAPPNGTAGAPQDPTDSMSVLTARTKSAAPLPEASLSEEVEQQLNKRSRAFPLSRRASARTPAMSAGGNNPTAPAKPAEAGISQFDYDTPDVSGNTTADDESALQWAAQDTAALVAGHESGDGASRRLQALGYVLDDGAAGGGGAGPVARIDPATAGRLLAASCAPSDVLRFQSKVALALGISPETPASDVERDRDAIVREFLDRLSRRQNEPPRDMFFRYFGDHPFVSTRIDSMSTFGMDVDTASYALARAYLAKGMLPPKVAVRTEEFVNAFRHDLAPPNGDDRDDKSSHDVFAIHTEVAPSPFGDEGQLLLQVGLKARVVPKSQRKPVALTFVIDVSGSMSWDGRLELVKHALHLLVSQLDERDTIGIVSFETKAHRILAPTNASKRERILASLDQLRPEGSTNVDEGLRYGYEMALEQLRSGAENRLILCSDGVANEGVTDPKVLSARIDECKSKYIYLNCIGVGMGNHNDALMDQLADEGDGWCAYLDRIEEAKKIFVDRLTGTLMTVARNAKIQVEFDPASVRRFRQLGYEKRALAHRDFRNDRVDAGEVGAGQEVVALYEIEPKADAAGPLATVRVRYEDPAATPAAKEAGAPVIREQARQVFAAEAAPTLGKTTPRFRLSACVAEFAEILRQSVHARDGSFGAVARLAEPLVDELKGDPDVPEFVALVQQAARLPDLLPPRNEMVRCVDELKKLHCWREELRDQRNDADEQLMRQLEEQNRRLEQALRDALDRALRHS